MNNLIRPNEFSHCQEINQNSFNSFQFRTTNRCQLSFDKEGEIEISVILVTSVVVVPLNNNHVRKGQFIQYGTDILFVLLNSPTKQSDNINI